MPQTNVAVDFWEFPRETVELIPLIVTVGSSATTSYQVACVPKGTRPSSWGSPDVAGFDAGYLVNGPTLSASSAFPAEFLGFVRIDSNPEDPVIPAFTLKLT